MRMKMQKNFMFNRYLRVAGIEFTGHPDGEVKYKRSI
jgi:hypothetical protein